MPDPDPTDPSGEPPGFVVVVAPGDRIHFLDWGGAGEPGIVLVHGLAASVWVWAPVARRLIAARRTVAMDLRGHGLSDAPTEDGARFTPEWKQYKIDLSLWSVSSVIGAFGFATNDTDNPGQTQSIYFDDIVWE